MNEDSPFYRVCVAFMALVATALSLLITAICVGIWKRFHTELETLGFAVMILAAVLIATWVVVAAAIDLSVRHTRLRKQQVKLQGLQARTPLMYLSDDHKVIEEPAETITETDYQTAEVCSDMLRTDKDGFSWNKLSVEIYPGAKAGYKISNCKNSLKKLGWNVYVTPPLPPTQDSTQPPENLENLFKSRYS